MNLKEINSLKYFILLALVIISFYVYSGITGWKWLGATSTETEKPEQQQHQNRYFHK